MIDEKKLIEYLETLAEFECKKSQESAEIGAFDMATCYGHGEYCYKNAINATKEQPKIGGWIPCSERLPEERQDVLVFDAYNNMYIAHRILSTFFDNEMNDINVIAWQPLPEEYHG